MEYDPWPGYNNELKQTFPSHLPLFEEVVEFDNGEETLGMNETFSERRWTEMKTSDVDLFQQAFDWFADPALAYFLPAFMLTAVEHHCGDGMDAAFLEFACGPERRLLSIGLTEEQTRLAVRIAGWLIAQYPENYERHLDAIIALRRHYLAPAEVC